MSIFPKRANDPEVTGPMLIEISDVVQKHLGFLPTAQVLILAHPEGAAKTFFAGPTLDGMDRMISEALENHRRARGH